MTADIPCLKKKRLNIPADFRGHKWIYALNIANP